MEGRARRGAGCWRAADWPARRHSPRKCAALLASAIIVLEVCVDVDFNSVPAQARPRSPTRVF